MLGRLRRILAALSLLLIVLLAFRLALTKSDNKVRLQKPSPAEPAGEMSRPPLRAADEWKADMIRDYREDLEEDLPGDSSAASRNSWIRRLQGQGFK